MDDISLPAYCSNIIWVLSCFYSTINTNKGLILNNVDPFTHWPNVKKKKKKEFNKPKLAHSKVLTPDWSVNIKLLLMLKCMELGVVG